MLQTVSYFNSGNYVHDRLSVTLRVIIILMVIIMYVAGCHQEILCLPRWSKKISGKWNFALRVSVVCLLLLPVVTVVVIVIVIIIIIIVINSIIIISSSSKIMIMIINFFFPFLLLFLWPFVVGVVICCLCSSFSSFLLCSFTWWKVEVNFFIQGGMDPNYALLVAFKLLHITIFVYYYCDYNYDYYCDDDCYYGVKLSATHQYSSVAKQ